MGDSQSMNQGQTYAQSGVLPTRGVIALPEQFEDMRQEIGRNPAAVVCHRKANESAFEGHAHRYLTIFLGGELDGVVQ